MSVHIISIGISSYRCGNNLQYAADDAELVMQSFSSNLADDVSYKRLLTNNEAQLTDIRVALNSASKEAKEDDTLIFYFSGHGTYQGNSTFLAPYDIVLDNVEVTGLPSGELQKWIDDSNYKTKIILLDCCYSGGINAKSIARPTSKSPKNLKTIDKMEFLSKGVFIFTACRGNESAYELPSIGHGVFTHCLIDELSKGTGREQSVAVSNIISPVNNAIDTIVTNVGMVQIPTSYLSQEGEIRIPTVRKSLKRSPEFLAVPTMQDSGIANAVPELTISEKDMKTQIEQSMSLTRVADTSRAALFAYQSYLLHIINNIRIQYQKQPKDIYDMAAMENIIADTEANCLQLVVLVTVATLVGGDTVFDIISRQVPIILGWEAGQGGTKIAINTPEIIVLLLEYVVAICSIYSGSFDFLGKLLDCTVRADQVNPPEKLVDYEGLHYADSLGRNAKTVFDHVFGFFGQQKWLYELLGIDKASLQSLVLQANLCLCAAKTDSTGPIYSAYNNYDITKVMPFVDEIHYNQKIRKAILPIFHKRLKEQEIAEVFANAVEKMNDFGRDHWWGHILLKRKDFTDIDVVKGE